VALGSSAQFSRAAQIISRGDALAARRSKKVGSATMTLDDLLAQLDHVKPRGSRFSAKCPAHADKNPSLSIREGERGILVRCFANCSLKEICAALSIKPRELFYNSRVDRASLTQRTKQQRARTRARELDDHAIDALREAEYFVRSRSRIDISNLSDQQLDDELNALADAYAVLESERGYDYE
jgi:hypothetical protein